MISGLSAGRRPLFVPRCGPMGHRHFVLTNLFHAMHMREPMESITRTYHWRVGDDGRSSFLARRRPVVCASPFHARRVRESAGPRSLFVPECKPVDRRLSVFFKLFACNAHAGTYGIPNPDIPLAGRGPAAHGEGAGRSVEGTCRTGRRRVGPP